MYNPTKPFVVVASNSGEEGEHQENFKNLSDASEYAVKLRLRSRIIFDFVSIHDCRIPSGFGEELNNSPSTANMVRDVR